MEERDGLQVNLEEIGLEVRERERERLSNKDVGKAKAAMEGQRGEHHTPMHVGVNIEHITLSLGPVLAFTVV